MANLKKKSPHKHLKEGILKNYFCVMGEVENQPQRMRLKHMKKTLFF
jgi:hypothetical protein